MADVENDERVAGPDAGRGGIPCTACESALESPGRETVSFLLLDQLTIPLVGCAEHKRQFSDVCGLTTEDAATLLDHQPAGGVRCPGCRHSTHRVQHPVVPVADGAVAILGCSRHVDDVVERFHAGLRTQQRLTTSLPSGPG